MVYKEPLERYLWLWSEWVTRAGESERIASGRYLEVRCEELCADYRGTGEQPLAFLWLEGSRRFWRALRTAGLLRSGSAGGWREERCGEPIADLLRELDYA
jgi:hypothetical protein